MVWVVSMPKSAVATWRRYQRQCIFGAGWHVPQPHPKSGKRTGDGEHQPCSHGEPRGFRCDFDTDVDRAACVDAAGNEINKNRFIALAAQIATEGVQGATIVTDSTTSDGLKNLLSRISRGFTIGLSAGIRM